MPYLIDGHNLIPKLGLRLDSIDDELELISVLQDFCRVERRPAEVYFDGAPPGRARTIKTGALSAHFVRAGSSADAAIAAQINNLGRAARNWIVVSSDRAVQQAARTAHAQVLPSEAFARQLKEGRRPAPGGSQERALSAEEISEWLKLFGRKD